MDDAEMRKGRRQKLINAEEYDLLYAKHMYCYLVNNNKTVQYIKRKMNRRWRRELNLEMLEAYEEDGDGDRDIGV